MKGLAIVSKGIEDVAAKEISELIGAKAKVEKCCTIFTIERLEELCVLCYKSQAADKILCLFDEFEFKDDTFAELIKRIKKIDIKEWIENRKYSIKCIRKGEHGFSSVDVEAELKKEFAEKFGKEFRCEYSINDAEVILLVFIVDGKCYIGIDFSGMEMQKRDYKIFPHSSSLRAPLAYSLVRICGFKEGEILLDPFVADGVVIIETALFDSKFSPRHYSKDKFIYKNFNQFKKFDFEKFYAELDKGHNKKSKTEIYGFGHQFRDVDKVKKNAKIAGILDFIKLSRAEIEWMDVKFKGKSVDRIVTRLPTVKDASDRIFNNFFNQAEFVLKDNGRIALITYPNESILKIAEKNSFKLEHEREVYSGKQMLKILVYQKI